MIYVFPITTPANTPAIARQKTILDLARGRVTRGMLEFPSGHVGLTHIAINDGLHQLWPTNADGDFSASNETISFAEDYSLLSGSYQLQAYTWNEDDTYDHKITVRIELEALEQSTTSLWDEIKALLTPAEAS